MAQTMNINSLAFSKKLRAAGASEELAEAIVEGISEVDTTNLATKGDIADVKKDIAELRVEIGWIKLIGGAILATLILPYLAQVVGLG